MMTRHLSRKTRTVIPIGRKIRRINRISKDVGHEYKNQSKVS